MPQRLEILEQQWTEIMVGRLVEIRAEMMSEGMVEVRMRIM